MDISVTEERKKVWLALSDLFLDTEQSDTELVQLGAYFAGTSFSMNELKSILLTEVGPVLIGNLFSVAGVWNGFDEEWLVQSINKHMAKNIKCTRLGDFMFWCFFRKKWQKIIDGFEAKKANVF